MWMDGGREVFCDRAHLYGEDPFGDQLAYTHAAQPHAEDATRFCIEYEFGEAFIAA